VESDAGVWEADHVADETRDFGVFELVGADPDAEGADACGLGSQEFLDLGGCFWKLGGEEGFEIRCKGAEGGSCVKRARRGGIRSG
jgi:hypothetical protein